MELYMQVSGSIRLADVKLVGVGDINDQVFVSFSQQLLEY